MISWSYNLEKGQRSAGKNIPRPRIYYVPSMTQNWPSQKTNKRPLWVCVCVCVCVCVWGGGGGGGCLITNSSALEHRMAI